MRKASTLLFLCCCIPLFTLAQTLQDDFEGSGNINTWYGDDCALNTSLTNPYQVAPNTSATVLEYHDTGGLYANVGFNAPSNFNLSSNYVFTLKVYIPSNGLTGSSPNQVSLKLQDGTLGSPWSTQCEIIKSVSLNQWNSLTFDFQNDPYINLDPNSPAPVLRNDFNRVLIQINGENNNDQVLAYIDDFFYSGTTTPGPVFNNLVWSDEFDVAGPIDTSKWHHQTLLPIPGSWYNGEIQHYTNRTDNSVVANDKLIITAKKETFTDQGYTKDYTSARLNSKFAFQYGRVEIMAKLPTGGGTWPAIWMLGKNITEPGGWWEIQGFGTTSWPACGEIDIMEHWGWNQNFVQSAMHTPSSFGGTVNHGGRTLATASSDFHLYALEWTADKMVFSVDNVVHYTYDPPVKDASTWPFDAEQYLLLNIAIEPSIDPAFTSSTMEIDYVRVYQEGAASLLPTEGMEQLTYYPNPVQDQLTIEVGETPVQRVAVNLLNTSGQTVRVFTRPVENGKIVLSNLNDLPKGLYIVSFELDNTPHCFKVVK